MGRVTSVTSTPVNSAKRKRMPRAQRERQMLDVAVQVFAERGFVATSMDEIAARVGVSKPMLYEYFDSKEGLLLAAVRDARAELRAVTEQSIAGATSSKDALHRGLVAFFEFIARRREAYALLRHELGFLGAEASAEVESIRRQQMEIHLNLMRLYSPESSERELEAASEMLVGACERMAMWVERYDDITPEIAANYTLNIIWGGLAGLQRG